MKHIPCSTRSWIDEYSAVPK